MKGKPRWKRGLPTKERIGKRLHDFRIKNEVTQDSVAKAIGCSPSTLSYLEAGKFGSFELIEQVCWALGLELEDMMADPRGGLRARGRT